MLPANSAPGRRPCRNNFSKIGRTAHAWLFECVNSARHFVNAAKTKYFRGFH